VRKKRLKKSLNLPKIESHPPCPPRVYVKLYKYFETTLLPPQPRGRPPKTPTKAVIAASTSSPARQSPKTLPRQQQESHQRTTVQKHSLTRNPVVTSAPATSAIPIWVTPAICHLCTTLLAPAAIPYVIDGVTSILTQSSPFLSNDKNAAPEGKRDKVPALIIAVYFFVAMRLSNQETTGAEYVRQRKEAMATMEADPRVLGGGEAFGTKDVDAWVKEISERGWLRLDWFNDIPEKPETLLDSTEETAEPGAGDSTPIRMAGHAPPNRRPRTSSARNVLNNRNSSTIHIGLGTMVSSTLSFSISSIAYIKNAPNRPDKPGHY
jgi:origin recognition complex subunit 6